MTAGIVAMTNKGLRQGAAPLAYTHRDTCVARAGANFQPAKAVSSWSAPASAAGTAGRSLVAFHVRFTD